MLELELRVHVESRRSEKSNYGKHGNPNVPKRHCELMRDGNKNLLKAEPSRMKRLRRHRAVEMQKAKYFNGEKCSKTKSPVNQAHTRSK